jgi:hypothetical protein
VETGYILSYGRYDLGEGPLADLTDGCDGTSGWRHTPESLAKLRTALKGRTFSETHRANMRTARIGLHAGEANPNYGKRLSVEERANRSGENHPMFGKNHTAEARARISAANKGKWVGEKNPMFDKSGSESPHFGRKRTSETRARISAARMGKSSPMRGKIGKPLSPESRAKQSATHLQNNAIKRAWRDFEPLVYISDPFDFHVHSDGT